MPDVQTPILPFSPVAADEVSPEPAPVTSILIIGGGGHLGRGKLQPILWRFLAGSTDCLETIPPPGPLAQSA
jgi:hypothetical protein